MHRGRWKLAMVEAFPGSCEHGAAVVIPADMLGARASRAMVAWWQCGGSATCGGDGDAAVAIRARVAVMLTARERRGMSVYG
jgi:hypothetical protein